MKQWRYLVPIAVFAVLAAVFLVNLRMGRSVPESPMIGQPAPEFSLPSLRDPSTMVGTHDIADQFYLLNIWAFWCEVCHYEHPFLLELARSGVPIYGLNWKDERDEALSLIDTRGDPFVWSAIDEHGVAVIDYGVSGAPETFLIGPDRTILAKHTGELTPESWEAKFVPLIEAHRAGG